MPQRISMRDIAARANVSVMAVSLALRGSRRVSPATRERIQSLAKAMGFQPDPALRALMVYRHKKKAVSHIGTIAYLNNFDRPSIVTDISLHRNLFNGAQRRGAELGFKVEEFWLNQPGLNPGRASRILASRGIQGLLIGPQPTPHTQLELDWSYFTAVQLGFSLQSPRFHTIITDQFQASARIVRELCALGYRRIGLAIQHAQDERTENRYTGAYLAMQRKLPEGFPRIPILFGGVADESGFRDWFTRHRPDALIGLAGEICPYLEKMGVRIPADVGYAMAYPLKLGKLCFAHSEGRQEMAGVAALDQLSSMLVRNETGVPPAPLSILVSPDWTPGNTVRKVGPPVLLS